MPGSLCPQGGRDAGRTRELIFVSACVAFLPGLRVWMRVCGSRRRRATCGTPHKEPRVGCRWRNRPAVGYLLRSRGNGIRHSRV